MKRTREAAYRRIAKLVYVQWAVIFGLVVAIVILLVGQAKAEQSPDYSVGVVSVPEYIELAYTAPARESLGTFKTTAYCSCVKCCGIWSAQHPTRQGTDYVQRTSSGSEPKAGHTVAADLSVLPYGTVIYLDGSAYTVEDTGSGVDGNHIDVYFDDHQAALEWGVRYLEVYR